MVKARFSPVRSPVDGAVFSGDIIGCFGGVSPSNFKRAAASHVREECAGPLSFCTWDAINCQNGRNGPLMTAILQADMPE